MLIRDIGDEEWGAVNTLAVLLMSLAMVLAPCSMLRIHPAISYSDVFLIVGAFAVAITFIGQPRHFPVPSAVFVAALTLLISGLIGHARFDDPNNLIELLKFLSACIAVPLITAWALGFSRRAINIAIACWVLGATASAGLAVINKWGYYPFDLYDERIRWTGRYAGLTLYPNILGLYSAFAATVLAAAARRRQTVFIRLVIISLIILHLYAIQLTGSRAAILGLMIGLFSVFFLWQSDQNKLRATIRAILWAILIVALWTGAECLWGDCSSSVIRRLLGDGSTARSDAIRTSLQTAAWHDFWSNPIFGNGFSKIRDAHNLQLQILVAGGMLAFCGWLIYLSYFGLITFKAWRISYRSNKNASFAIIAASSCFLCWLANGLFQPFILERNPYLVIGLLLAHQFYVRGTFAQKAAGSRS